ncbi:pseudoazurin [Bdellovibrio bacteriovorus]|uniref:Pseudoazurin n=1 Tax=Bdellovibrio bacteriovorus str. Tiberius TaxID=1069642 RepID=K7YQM5_BDEBC|nr:pseudoazurin [Bdellovibrio bacteriovorus]AFY02176.1 pseudoazurin [Bdellovibrio bacteriovorus str. Tiberius]
MLKQTVLATALILAAALNAEAATHEIKMLNNGKEGIMVFEPAYLKAAKGDTIKFVPTDPSHDVSSVVVPKGAKAFSAPLNKPLTIKVTEEGVYVYECKIHLPMAMVGVIQVGTPTNLKEAQDKSKEMSKTFAMNKDRLDKYLNQVK